MRRVLYVVIMMALLAGVASAQDFPRVEIFGGYDLLKLGGSDINSLTSDIQGLEDYYLPPGLNIKTEKLFKKGFDASITFNANQYFGIEANFLFNKGDLVKISGTYEDASFDAKFKTSDFAFMAGPRFTYRKNEKVTPFAHVLFGVNRVKMTPKFTVDGEDYSSELSDYEFSDSGFEMAFGGGIDVNVNKAFAIRLIQADYFMAKHEDVTLSNMNLAFGVVFRFGGK